MKGFKNTTRTQYSMGGAAYAKGGMAKGAAKVAKVMGEFKRGELHSGSKEGPKVTKPAQAKAIAMSEARKAGMKAPMKKNEGGKVGKMPPLGESVKSGNRMSKMTADEMRAMEARFGEKKRPSPADSAKSANRIAKEEAAEARALGVFKEGGKVRKYAEGGAVKPMGQTTAAYGAQLREQVKAGKMTNAQAQAAQNAFIKEQMAARSAADAKATAAKPMGQVTAAYGANLREQVKAGKMTNAQAQAAQNAFIKQQMSPANAATLQSTMAQAAPQMLGFFPGTTDAQRDDFRRAMLHLRPGDALPPNMQPQMQSPLPPAQIKPPPPMQPPMPTVGPPMSPMQPPARGPATPRIGYGTTDPRMQRGGLAVMPKGKR